MSVTAGTIVLSSGNWYIGLISTVLGRTIMADSKISY